MIASETRAPIPCHFAKSNVIDFISYSIKFKICGVGDKIIRHKKTRPTPNAMQHQKNAPAEMKLF
jgi:hypothetical protein